MIQHILTVPQDTEEKDASEQLTAPQDTEEKDPSEQRSSVQSDFDLTDPLEVQAQAQKEKYFEICAERRERFNHLLDTQSELKFSKPAMYTVKYDIDGVKFQCQLSIRKSKAIKGEPTLWSMETIMPSDPEEFRFCFGNPEQKMKWDTKVKSFDRKMLSEEDNGDHLAITNALADKYLGGAISARQFTNIVHSKTMDENTIESVSCTIDHEEFPVKDGFVKAWSTMYGLRVTGMDSEELSGKYEIPELKDDSGDVLKWSKIQLLFQADLKGSIPTWIIEKGTSKATNGTFEVCRMYILRDVKGFNVKQN